MGEAFLEFPEFCKVQKGGFFWHRNFTEFCEKGVNVFYETLSDFIVIM